MKPKGMKSEANAGSSKAQTTAPVQTGSPIENKIVPETAPAQAEPVPSQEGEQPIEALDVDTAGKEDLIRFIGAQGMCITAFEKKVEALKASLSEFAEIPIEAGAHDNTTEYSLARSSRTKIITTGMVRKARMLCGFMTD